MERMGLTIRRFKRVAVALKNHVACGAVADGREELLDETGQLGRGRLGLSLAQRLEARVLGGARLLRLPRFWKRSAGEPGGVERRKAAVCRILEDGPS